MPCSDSSDGTSVCESFVSADIETLSHLFSEQAEQGDSGPYDKLPLLLAAACKHPPPEPFSWLTTGFHPEPIEAACEAWRTVTRRQRIFFAPVIPILYVIVTLLRGGIELPEYTRPYWAIPVCCALCTMVCIPRLKEDSQFNRMVELMYVVGAAWRSSIAATHQPMFFDGTDAQLNGIVYNTMFFVVGPIAAKLLLDPPMWAMMVLHLGPCYSYLFAISDTAAVLQPQLSAFLFLPTVLIFFLEHNKRLGFIEALQIARLQQQVANLECTVQQAHEEAVVLEEYRSLFEGA